MQSILISLHSSSIFYSSLMMHRCYDVCGGYKYIVIVEEMCAPTRKTKIVALTQAVVTLRFCTTIALNRFRKCRAHLRRLYTKQICLYAAPTSIETSTKKDILLNNACIDASPLGRSLRTCSEQLLCAASGHDVCGKRGSACCNISATTRKTKVMSQSWQGWCLIDPSILAAPGSSPFLRRKSINTATRLM